LNIERKSAIPQFRKALDELLKREVLVGIPAAGSARDLEMNARDTANIKWVEEAIAAEKLQRQEEKQIFSKRRAREGYQRWKQGGQNG
jgi:hypothetical protein